MRGGVVDERWCGGSGVVWWIRSGVMKVVMRYDDTALSRLKSEVCTGAS